MELPAVAPPAQRLRCGQVVVGTRGADGQQCHAQAGEGLGFGDQCVTATGSGLAADGRGAFDVVGVAADGGTVVGQHGRLGRVGVAGGEAVPHVGVFGDQAQRLFLTLAADQDREVARGRRIQFGQTGFDAGQRSAEVVEPTGRGAEFVAVFVVVFLFPARPDAEYQTPVADVVDGAGHVGEQLGVAVGVAGHQCADFDARRLLGPGAQHRPGFEVGAVGIAVEREEVVPVERNVDADVLTAADRIADDAVLRGVLRLQLHADADGTKRVASGRGHTTTVGTYFASTPRRISTKASGWSLCTECPEFSTTCTPRKSIARRPNSATSSSLTKPDAPPRTSVMGAERALTSSQRPPNSGKVLIAW